MNPKFRGQRLSTPCISLAITTFIGNNTSVRKILAEIKPENTASVKCFSRVGFVKHKEGEKCSEYVLDVEKTE